MSDQVPGVVASDRHYLEQEVLANADGRTIPELAERLRTAFGREYGEVSLTAQRLAYEGRLRFVEERGPYQPSVLRHSNAGDGT